MGYQCLKYKLRVVRHSCDWQMPNWEKESANWGYLLVVLRNACQRNTRDSCHSGKLYSPLQEYLSK